jgi:CDP-diacylglycerol--glycerol-3-phosphate 3-phosphatidyltransferase
LPSVYDVKPRFQAMLRPLVGRLAAAGISANAVTIGAAVLSIATGLVTALLKSDTVLLSLPVVLFVRMALNAIDGMLAREHGQKTKLGALLNELGDVISDMALYLGLIPHVHQAALVVAIVLIAAVGECAGILGQTIGATRRYDGPMGKSDRAVAFGFLAVVVWLLPPMPRVVQILLMLILVAGCATVWNRCRRALKEAGNA